MKVRRAASLGFCFGVKRALDMTERALAAGRTLYVLGELIHNAAVVERLEQLGLTRIDKLSSIREPGKGALVVRAHGVSRDTYEEAGALGLSIVDATCPFVEKAQQAAATLVKEGYRVLLAGDRDHAEVKGIVSAAGGRVTVVQSLDELPETGGGDRVGLLFQTTMHSKAVSDFAAALAGRCAELRLVNTVCKATQDRQNAIAALAPQVDAMVVVGDPGSANTARLTAIAGALNPRTVQVENASQLREDFFESCRTVGLGAGASTPDWLIDEVAEWLDGR